MLSLCTRAQTVPGHLLIKQDKINKNESSFLSSKWKKLSQCQFFDRDIIYVYEIIICDVYLVQENNSFSKRFWFASRKTVAYFILTQYLHIHREVCGYASIRRPKRPRGRGLKGHLSIDQRLGWFWSSSNSLENNWKPTMTEESSVIVPDFNYNQCIIY